MAQSSSKGKEVKAMSQLLKFGLLFCVSLAFADESSIELVLAKLDADVKAKERPANLPVLLVGIEDDLLSLPEQAKANAVARSLSLSVGLLSLRDQTVPIDGSVGRWPAFDWKKYGAKPLFAGASPDSIQDKIVREAYIKALDAHDLLLNKVAAEKTLLEDIDYFLSLQRRVIKSSAAPQVLLDAASAYLSSSEVQKWAADYIKQRLFDPPPAEASKPLQSENETVATNSGVVASPLNSQPVVQTMKPTNPDLPSPTQTPSNEPTSSTPWSIIVVLSVAGCGLLWLFLKRRS